jgi:SHS2 domain-containing protein
MEAPPFEVLEHTADVGLVARGKNLSELFCNAGRGMFSLICDASAVQKKETVPIELRDETLDFLFFDWLDELLFLTSARRYVFCDFTAEVNVGQPPSAVEFAVRGAAAGERMDRRRHDLRLEIKAVTYHELKVAKQGDIWTATVIFDV